LPAVRPRTRCVPTAQDSNMKVLVRAKVDVTDEIFDVIEINEVKSKAEAVRKALHYGKRRLAVINTLTSGLPVTLVAEEMQ